MVPIKPFVVPPLGGMVGLPAKAGTTNTLQRSCNFLFGCGLARFDVEHSRFRVNGHSRLSRAGGNPVASEIGVSFSKFSKQVGEPLVPRLRGDDGALARDIDAPARG